MTTASLRGLASRPDALETPKDLLRCLKAQKSEGRYLEWKRYPPIGRGVGRKEKYRWVKAAISFANADGGFVVFGVDSGGRWLGLDEEIQAIDPAQLEDLINGCIAPEIADIGFGVLRHSAGPIGVLQMSCSPMAPHITTKDIHVDHPGRQKETVLSKHALYYRSGAKSKIATPSQHQRIVHRRVEELRSQLVRRIREVKVPSVTDQVAGVGTTIRVVVQGDDPKARVVRLTRDRRSSGGNFLVHEALDEGLFEEVNNILEANRLMAGEPDRFLLSEEIYYRIYAERQYVLDGSSQALLARVSLRQIYGPSNYWLLKSTASEVAASLAAVAEDDHEPYVRTAIRAAMLLGEETEEWLWKRLQKRWGRRTQAPSHYYSFKRIRERGIEEDVRLRALRTQSQLRADFPHGKGLLRDYLDSPEEAAKNLTECCLLFFHGEKRSRISARAWDVVAYGHLLPSKGASVVEALAKHSGAFT